MSIRSFLRPARLAAISGVTALATISCGGSATPLSPSSTGRAATPTGAFSVATSRAIHALEEFPATPGAATTAPCTPLTTTTTPAATPAQNTEGASAVPAVPPSNYYAPYSIRKLADDTTAPATTTPAVPCATVQILITGTVGTQAFSPNPGTAAVGDSLVWTNNDLRPHKIVIDDGTPTGTALGVIAPGETSTAFTLSGASAAYHCEFHPSMVGTINAPLPGTTSTTGATTTDAGASDAPATPSYDSGYGYYRLKSE